MNEILFNRLGQAQSGRNKGWFFEVEDDRSGTGGFYIYLYEHADRSGTGYDIWLETAAEVSEVLKTWRVDWLEDQPDAQA